MGTSVRGFYLLTQEIKDTLLNDVNVNTVTTGDLSDINLKKQNIFPLSHLIVNNVTSEEQALVFNISVLSMDIVDVRKEEETDIFLGNDNTQDILNTQLSVLVKLAQKIRMGSVRDNGFELLGDPNIEPFKDRFENQLAGWALTMDVLVANDIYIC